MKAFNYILCLLIALSFNKYTQAQTIERFEVQKRGSYTFEDLTPSWHANIFSREAPYPGSDSYRNYIHQLKQLRYSDESSSAVKTIKTRKKTNNEQAIYSLGFEGNFFGGIPNDNDIAISNEGIIVSVSNSDMYVYDESGVTLLDVGLDEFADSLGLLANSYDPKVIYDPTEDKFILVFLNGNSSTSTDIVLCFSQTNDPSQGWHVYSLPGNPFNNNAWSDFPMIAITEQDFFVTVNHINSDSVSWQTGFMQSVIWQVKKSEGYLGAAINTVVHGDVNFQGKPVRNLLPVKGGFDIKNHEMYFISNRNFDLANDTFFIVKIAESLEQNEDPSFTVQSVLANQEYGMPPDAQQTASTFLQTNDARPLSGLIENGVIHFVGNTVRLTSNKASVYHGKLNTSASNWGVELEIFEDDDLEYGYPNLSFTGQSYFDEQLIISFNHTSIDSFPGVSAIFFSEEDGYSERLHLVSGDSKVNLLSGSFERWGDYSGSQKKYNEPGTVWINGFMGFRNNLALSKDQHKTFIAKLISPDSLSTGIHDIPRLPSVLYPNPVVNQFYFQFEIQSDEYLVFKLFDIQGKLIDKLLEEQLKKGAHEFLFMLDQLNQGVYTLQVSNLNQDLIFTEKIMKH
ncbi:MAG: T9SS type A sorting domain-containing protein [Chitinophagales bacterium]|nr:T9SS type A sorting domain-containing protein [Chitinophagales bacterium]